MGGTEKVENLPIKRKNERGECPIAAWKLNNFNTAAGIDNCEAWSFDLGCFCQRHGGRFLRFHKPDDGTVRAVHLRHQLTPQSASVRVRWSMQLEDGE
jgi:hypothetical protein